VASAASALHQLRIWLPKYSHLANSSSSLEKPCAIAAPKCVFTPYS
jgi:hypothetical protein